ncbi:MAG: hypothetical protein GY720_02325 [bacterium]|nr:hypothetical protein [bacterium]
MSAVLIFSYVVVACAVAGAALGGFVIADLEPRHRATVIFAREGLVYWHGDQLDELYRVQEDLEGEVAAPVEVSGEARKGQWFITLQSDDLESLHRGSTFVEHEFPSRISTLELDVVSSEVFEDAEPTAVAEALRWALIGALSSMLVVAALNPPAYFRSADG